MTEAPQGHNALAKPGFISGTGVIRDKDGNVKGEFEFSAPATPEQAASLGLIPQPSQESL